MPSRPRGVLRGRAAAVITLVLVASPCWSSGGRAAADPIELGGFIGPRFFANRAALGERAASPTSLQNAVILGARLARPFFPWLVAEAELPITATSTNEFDVDVFWMEPRAHARLELLPAERVRPFVTLGAGMPVVLSSKRGLYGSDLTVDMYVGGGVHVSPRPGVSLRLDVRSGLVPGRGETALAPELEIVFGVSVHLGGGSRDRRVAAPVADADKDRIGDEFDQCIDRPEDIDGFEDQDGCPDIDNDGDRVLDIADKCPAVAETNNGFQDDDGCPDTMPSDVAALAGTIEGLAYGTGEIDVRPTAERTLDRIAAILAKHPSVRIVLVGHTDDQEALLPVGPEEGETAPDPAALALELSRTRADQVRQALLRRGVGAGRIDVQGKGADAPVSEGNTPRARLRNRRVELRLFVPVR
jgi:OmpA-OmpF porin, OOP family